MDHQPAHELDRGPEHDVRAARTVPSAPAAPATGPDPDRAPDPATDPWVVAPAVTTDAGWLDAEAALDDCDGYLVVAVDPQTGEVDAHGPYAGLGAVHAAEDMRATFLREELDDVVVRIVRWHEPQARYAA